MHPREKDHAVTSEPRPASRPTREELAEAVAALAAAIDTARSLVAAGHLVDLASLEAGTADLARRLAEAAPADRPVLQPAILALLSSLQVLGTEITQRCDALKAELARLDDRKRAASAYRGGPPR